ncbi:hypothetical protein [Aminobacter carboxidus]|uniref:N-acetyltransferase n=1 Tax=Aminobacter carboxidus TaxID=376165 RepID=A0ABR9GIW0_9HYPH|nr:hypothetical protein [Aminobacter carboxidus]MBE1203587.1 hypothetical protein [Aminobacter carboxidus]
MGEISFRPFRNEDLMAYAAWFDDAEVSRRIDVPSAGWVAYVLDPASPAHAVVATRDESASLQAEAPDDGLLLYRKLLGAGI